MSREELDRVFMSYDQRFTDQQRQLDDVKQAQGNVYGARDILLDLRERIDASSASGFLRQPNNIG